MGPLDAVVDYIRVLGVGLDTTAHAGDRGVYERHLAAAARLVALVVQGRSQTEIEEWLRGEERAFGVGYLSGEEGEQAERAFAALKAALAQG